VSLALEGASAATLRAISAALRNGQLGTALSPLAIARVAPSCSETAAQELIRLSGEGMQAAHLALLVDTMAKAVEVRLANSAELVWTGPESSVAHSRDTAIVVAELFRSATTSVLVSTFVVQQAETVFKVLAERMEEVPGLRVQVFVHVGRDNRDTRHESEILREFATDLRRKWPGPNRPWLYYHSRSLAANAQERATWHAKVVVIDDETAFVTSANFTEWAQQRNVEAGVLIRNAEFARQLRQQFEGLVQSRAVLEVPGFRS
jgi:phosphatidylserine/phosphatidylglycerophosphate/cardiolipin synthase-like enzyme